jgi:hypothetical protein
MSQPTLEDFSDLDQTGYAMKEPEKPEEAFFHSIYIGGKERKNHLNIVEQSGKLHIRGVAYNLPEVNMIVTTVKTVLVKNTKVAGRDSIECFSFQEGQPPWKGTSGNVCGKNSAERAASTYCNQCRSHLIVAGIYVDENGNPHLDKESNKPFFVFIRARGTKYTKVSNYLGELSKVDFSPIFTPVTESSKEFEKKNVNHKRVVTKITVGSVDTTYGKQPAFDLTRGKDLPDKTVMDILKVSQKLIPKFIEKFDWSRRKGSQTASGYGEEGPQQFDEKEPEQKEEPKAYNFDQFKF